MLPAYDTGIFMDCFVAKSANRPCCIRNQACGFIFFAHSIKHSFFQAFEKKITVSALLILADAYA